MFNVCNTVTFASSERHQDKQGARERGRESAKK